MIDFCEQTKIEIKKLEDVQNLLIKWVKDAVSIVTNNEYEVFT